LLAIKEVRVSQVAPYFALVGSEQIIFSQEASAFLNFFETLFMEGDVVRAMEKLSGKFQLFLAERVFLKGFSDYLKKSCRGHARADRNERLISALVERKIHNILSLPCIRKLVKNNTRPRRDHFEDFKNRFLLADHPENRGRFSCTFEQALQLAEKQ